MGKRGRPTYNSTSKRAKKSRRSTKRGVIKRARKLLAKPRLAVKKGLSAINTHCFSRNRTTWINLFGNVAAPDSGIVGESNVQYNLDSTYGIVDLSTFWSQYPDCVDSIELENATTKWVDHNAFKDLFSQYQITGVDTRLTPNFSQPMQSGGSGSDYMKRIPNYEIFVIPSTKQTNYRVELHHMLRIELGAFLNVTKAKSRRMIPSRVQNYKCTRPKVVSFDTSVEKGSGIALTEMTAPPWLKTDDPHVSNDSKETHVKHYSYKLLIRRVDGRPLVNSNPTDGWKNDQQLGFRWDQTIYFKCRSTPRDVIEKVAK